MAPKKAAKKKVVAKKKMSKMDAVEIGAGVLAAVAAAGAAGYYFYGTKNAKKHRQATAKWVTGLKKDVIREAKKLKKLDEAALAAIVDNAAKTYKGMQEVTPKELKEAVAELKGNWTKLRKEMAPKPAVKKAVKKVVKKATKKTK
ncbi:hypothetical protein KJ819_02450 [Patescibacteria group bacterium]|nr:hypothetical protein [Patescibacteria group bacterium]MBU1500857.1 hypothetical protein [Patescibacteria group bacterium]MBU2080912.1 hypothetical protein [Patescibacteria group bacterium]MBU2124017.1 hypothetical protein [Patescibacteria group bacterium]MBU2194692.1 hypothetical protein [Patescibacteria group bacterium]